jgi:glycosyltransferase involved in cell wall biosynthesis
VTVVPYAVEPFPGARERPAGRPGPIVGYAGRLESDRAWEIAVDAVARIRARHPAAQLVFGRSGPIAGLVRSHARAAGLASATTFLEDVPPSLLFGGIDMLVVPGSFDGLPYAVAEALVAGVPVIGADAGGIGDTLSPYAAWIVPDDARGFDAGIEEAWSEIDAAWSAAQAQREATEAAFAPATRRAELLAKYERMAGEPLGSEPLVNVSR